MKKKKEELKREKRFQRVKLSVLPYKNFKQAIEYQIDSEKLELFCKIFF
jgi:hypothetical protein